MSSTGMTTTVTGFAVLPPAEPMMMAMSTSPQNGDLLTSPPWDFNTTGSTDQVEYWDGGHRLVRPADAAATAGWSQILGDGTTPEKWHVEATVGIDNPTNVSNNWSTITFGAHSGTYPGHGNMIVIRLRTTGDMLASVGRTVSGVNLRTSNPATAFTNTTVVSGTSYGPHATARLKVRLDVDNVARSITIHVNDMQVYSGAQSYTPDFTHTGWRAGVMVSQVLGAPTAMVYDLTFGVPGMPVEKVLGGHMVTGVGFQVPLSVVKDGPPGGVTLAPDAFTTGIGWQVPLHMDTPDWLAPAPLHMPVTWSARIGMIRGLNVQPVALGFGASVSRMWIMPPLPENPVLIVDRLRPYVGFRAAMSVNRPPVPEPDGLSIVPIKRDSRFYKLAP